MISHDSLDEFVALFDLYDRGVDYARVLNDASVDLVFDMFHCDDPARSDEGKVYTLTMTFHGEDVVVREGELIHESHVSGEVLKHDRSPGCLVLGIEWTDYKNRSRSWCEIEISRPPFFINEIISKRP